MTRQALRRAACRILGHRRVKTRFEPSPVQPYAYRVDCTRCGAVLGTVMAPWIAQLIRSRQLRYTTDLRRGATFADSLEDAQDRDRAPARPGVKGETALGGNAVHREVGGGPLTTLNAAMRRTAEARWDQ